MAKAKNTFQTRVVGDQATVLNAETIHYKAAAAKGKTEYPSGCIGADLIKRNYVKHLVDRYHRFKQAETSFGKSTGRFSYAVIYRNIEAKFKAPAYFVPTERFDELVDYLHGRIDQTILGKRNRARGYSNYESFDEYQLAQMTEAH